MKSYTEVYAMVAGLKAGDEILLDGMIVPVQREIYHQDGTGHPHSYGIKVGYGPGRWNTFIGIDSIMHGVHEVALKV